MTKERPAGVSSRLRRAAGRRRTWKAGNGTLVELPLIVDYVVTGESGRPDMQIEATVDLVAGRPMLTHMSLVRAQGLDVQALQREFRWQTPLDIVERMVPRLLAEGIDPFSIDLPVTGFPEAASGSRKGRGQLSDAFLRDIAEEYLRLGRGYARRIALERNVSPRTVVSWVVKARERGILGPAPKPGAYGGDLRAT
ncbi:MAG: hypothetical protein RL134_1693 [Actinomycetota bacterium]